MKRSILIFSALTVILFLSLSAALAQIGGGGTTGQTPPMHPPLDPNRAQGAGPSGDTSNKTPGELLMQNTQLNSQIQSLLPPGTDTQTAVKGFKSLSQFVAAVHVSKNLGIPFDDLKAKITGSNAVSLVKAVQELQPSANAKEAAKEGNRQAKQDIAGSKPPAS